MPTERPPFTKNMASKFLLWLKFAKLTVEFRMYNEVLNYVSPKSLSHYEGRKIQDNPTNNTYKFGKL